MVLTKRNVVYSETKVNGKEIDLLIVIVCSYFPMNRHRFVAMVFDTILLEVMGYILNSFSFLVQVFERTATDQFHVDEGMDY